MLKTSLRHFLMLALFVGTSTSAFAGDLNVSAASSLTNAFKDIAQSYQAQYPDAKVQLNFAASGTLLQQLAKGAPVDVLATADQDTMDAAEKQGLILVKERKDFVRNSLVLIQPISSTIKIECIEDLQQAAVKRIAVGNPASVPVGRYAQAALQATRVLPKVESKLINTLNVRQALDYVARDEVEAGFVYASDAALMLDKVKVAAQIRSTKTLPILWRSQKIAIIKSKPNASYSF